MITIYDWFGYQISIEDRYRLIKEAGFDGVLMWWSDGFGRGEYLEGPEKARKAGLYIENIHTPIQNQNDLWMDNLVGETEAQLYLQCVKDCADFEIPAMVVHLPNDEHVINELGLDRVKRIAEKAEKLGINVAMENLWNIKNLEAVLTKIDSPRVGFCYDSCHHANNPDAGDLLKKYGQRLMTVHLHDNGGIHNQHQLPFDGGIDWPAVMKKIAETGYTGAIALEPMNWDYKELSPEEFLRKAYEKAKILEENYEQHRQR